MKYTVTIRLDAKQVAELGGLKAAEAVWGHKIEVVNPPLVDYRNLFASIIPAKPVEYFHDPIRLRKQRRSAHGW